MAVDLSPSKKKSRAEYFREYRRRKSTAQENLALVESKPGRKTQSSTSFSLNKLQIHKIGLFFISICTTAYLVFVSASYLEGPLWLRICLALLSEIILLVLVTLIGEAFAKKTPTFPVTPQMSRTYGFQVPTLQTPIVIEN